MPTDIVAKTLVFNDRGELLLLRRSADDEHRPGGFDLPGGQVEAGETPSAGAIREAAEEAGLRLRPEDMELVFAETQEGFAASRGENVSWVKLLYAARAVQSDVVLSHEHDGYGWYSREALRTADYPSLQAALGYFEQHGILDAYWQPDGAARA